MVFTDEGILISIGVNPSLPIITYKTYASTLR